MTSELFFFLTLSTDSLVNVTLSWSLTVPAHLFFFLAWMYSSYLLPIHAQPNYLLQDSAKPFLPSLRDFLATLQKSPPCPTSPHYLVCLLSIPQCIEKLKHDINPRANEIYCGVLSYYNTNITRAWIFIFSLMCYWCSEQWVIQSKCPENIYQINIWK